MPVPIMPVVDKSVQKNIGIDYSFLCEQTPMVSKRKVIASNGDAQLLFDLWAKGYKCLKANTIKMNPSLNVSSRDLMRLKVMGFINKDNDEIEFTSKGKKVITTMSLAEQSTFEKNRQNKKYTEILANMDKRGKKGFRTASDPKFVANNSNRLNLR